MIDIAMRGEDDISLCGRVVLLDVFDELLSAVLGATIDDNNRLLRSWPGEISMRYATSMRFDGRSAEMR